MAVSCICLEKKVKSYARGALQYESFPAAANHNFRCCGLVSHRENTVQKSNSKNVSSISVLATAGYNTGIKQQLGSVYEPRTVVPSNLITGVEMLSRFRKLSVTGPCTEYSVLRSRLST
ncbi:hypothetical protein T310_5160 [Rasamsonia emersonii CBS 393.64]|uniref:Uncharacterized protein n=1 Tax=Rasamsonia emersonii (strain ATCC 16479 / CBS 393.64 / IMI 116815) TaxID=1408163 RepID=A0A0F4YR87_RASE3|nr:hypothetical protein T310_5160 [Rasamsonia emersonii CBS 393.64]KKA20797.1 hypothetical protein T310_5160 [Rasamsonia emersonii CBS 393.64]